VNNEISPIKLEPGEKLGGVYLLQRALETGAGPVIWLAQDEVLGKSVALHFLPVTVATDERALAEIRLDVKRNRSLIHPGILRVYDLVEGEGWAAVTTESFEGQRLSAVLVEHGRYEVREVDDWLDQICVALEEAHRIRLTHRDVSPENVFVTPGSRLLLANFGIGRAILNSLQRAGELPPDDSRWSNTSPQQLDAGASSAADDVYGIGSLFFALIAGRTVFAGGEMATQIRETLAPRLSEVRFDASAPGEAIPVGWDNVIAACLNKDRDERPAGPADIVSSIEAYADSVEPAASAVVPESEATKRADVEIAAAAVSASIEREAPVVTVHAEEEVHQKDELESPVAHSAEAEGEQSSIETPNEVSAKASPDVSPIVPEPANEVEKASPSPADSPSNVVSRRLYETEEDAFSSILPRQFRFPAAVAAAVVIVLFLINGPFKSEKESNDVPRALATSDLADRSELTTVKNTGRETISPPASDRPAPTERPPIEAPIPEASVNAPERPEMLMAAGPASKSPAAAAPTPSATSTASPADKQIAEKAAALEKLNAELANFEKQQEMRLKEKQTAETAVAEVQKAIEAKTQAASAAKKETEELIAARKQREEEQKAAELAAQAAQQLAAEKARAAEDAKKAFADFEAKNRAKLSMQDKADAEIQALQRSLDGRRKVADESARAATVAATAREQQIAAIQQSERELMTARAAVTKAAEEANRKVAVDSERKKLDDEIAAMRALFEQKMKDIEDRRRQLEGAPVAPTQVPSVPIPAAKAPVSEAARPVASAPPVLPLALMAARTEPPAAPVMPAAPLATPAPIVPMVPAPASGGATNSLGLRFLPVGDVQLSVWLTRWKDFDTFARAVNLKSTAWRGPGFRQGPDHPVVNVTWNEAIAFCKWLTDKEHKEGSLPANQFYRLPYDLEWSKGVGLATETGKTPEARDMGVPDLYPWGTDWPPPKGAGNYTGEETGSDVAIRGYDDGFAWTSPVGSFPANKLGLHDMGGNVWQWCMDTWNADSKARVLRGASWYNGALKLSLLASCRVHAAADSSTDNYGFRIVRSAEAVSVKPGRK